MSDSNNTTILDHLRVILVEPQGPLNVGSVARAMKNMGLSQLHLVNGVDPHSDEARMMAAGSKDILERVQVHHDLAAAISDCQIIIGTTARPRHRQPSLSPKEIASQIIADLQADQKVALVFGREDHGLYKEELARCQHVISIPTSEDRASINLAQAVLIVAYEIFQAAPLPAVQATTGSGQVISGEQWERLYREMIDCCADTGYMSAGSQVAMEQSLRRFLSIGPIQTRDARYIFGLLRRVQKVIRGEEAARPRPR